MQNVQAFIQEWTDDALGVKPIFTALYDDISNREDVRLEFHDRPGISYSLRAMHKDQNDRPLFAMIDVIDDEPKRRWLSVCFYGDTIEDPAELGDLIPEGLLGSDGYCFDITGPDAELTQYVCRRIHEAYENAGANP
jgi:hypothetical protein